jgi:flagellar hook-associated protein 3 FlgL
MTRVSTVGNYSSVLANLMAAQQRQNEAGDKVSTQKNGSSLKDYATQAETLTAMRSIQTRLNAYTDQNKLISDRLTNQDSGLAQIADAAEQTRQSIADALASGRVDTLMDDLQSQFANATQGLNTRYNGKYLFAGGQIDTPPFAGQTMSDLTAAPSIGSLFKNDDFKAQAKIDEATTITTGVLANDVGTNLMSAYKQLQAFQQGPNGPFNGPITDAQRTFLEGQLTSWQSLGTDLTNTVGRNGMLQSRVESVKTDLTSRSDSLSGMMGEITDADMGKAATDLQMAQMSLQASAQVFMSLQSSSLLNLLK